MKHKVRVVDSGHNRDRERQRLYQANLSQHRFLPLALADILDIDACWLYSCATWRPLPLCMALLLPSRPPLLFRSLPRPAHPLRALYHDYVRILTPGEASNAPSFQALYSLIYCRR